MKVLHINTEKTWRGGERQIELLANYGVRKFHSTIACYPKGQLHDQISKNHEVIDLSIRNGLDIRAALRLMRLSKKFDLIHCHTPKAQSVAILAKLFGCRKPIISTKRTSFPIGNNYFSRLKYRKTNQIVCVSQASSVVLQKQIPDIHIAVIHSAIEEAPHEDPQDLSASIPETRNRKIIGYVAAITEEKNPQTFIDTALSVMNKHDDCCFLWIGDGKLKPELISRIEALNLSDRIFFTGFQKNIRSWIASLHVLFFPSHSEGFPTTLLEAMRLSIPVVASDIDGIKEIISHGENGLLCDAKDSQVFTNEIIKVLYDDDLRNKLIDNALETAEGFYADKMAIKYQQLYDQILSD